MVATFEIIQTARTLLPNPEQSITSSTKLLGVSPGALYAADEIDFDGDLR